MNAAVFWRGVAIALVLSICAAISFSLLSGLIGSGTALRLVLLGITSACLFDQLVFSGMRTGRVLASAGWLLLVVGLVLIDPPLMLWLALPAAMLWLARSLTFSISPLRALLDAGISLTALGVAVVTLRQSGSVGLALWCWLLLQAVASSLVAPGVKNSLLDRFTSAQHSAEAALRHLLDPRVKP